MQDLPLPSVQLLDYPHKPRAVGSRLEIIQRAGTEVKLQRVTTIHERRDPVAHGDQISVRSRNPRPLASHTDVYCVTDS